MKGCVALCLNYMLFCLLHHFTARIYGVRTSEHLRWLTSRDIGALLLSLFLPNQTKTPHNLM